MRRDHLTFRAAALSNKEGQNAIEGVDDIEVRDVLDLTLTIDHNVVDGGPATRFAADLRRLLHTAAVLAPQADPSQDGTGN